MASRLLLLALASLALASPFSSLKSYTHSLQTRDAYAGVTDAQLAGFKYYVQYAAAAYCNFNTAAGNPVVCSSNACPSINAMVIASFTGPMTGIGGFVAVDDSRQEIVLSFRGSSNVRNFLDDVDFLKKPCFDLVGGCFVHLGFASAWGEIRDAATQTLIRAVQSHPSYRIVSTGHSLGAAVATIAAAYLRKSGYSIDLYTYGSPRVGNAIFVNFVTNQPGLENRITHLDDPVPRLPPALFGYGHTSPEYWLASGNATSVDYGVADIKVCTGIYNLTCNTGTGGLDIAAHLHYFQATGACGGGLTLKAREASNLALE